MSPKSCTCGHKNAPKTRTHGRYKAPLNRAELVEPARLVDLATRRPEIADLGLLRVASGCLESA